MDYGSIILAAAGGLGLFLYGMHSMASGLQKAAGAKMKKVLEVITKNRFMSIAIGALVTAIIQSSSATTVMVVGFVNAGLMDLAQTVGIIMGANIGTTATAWIVSSVEWASFLKPTVIAPIIVAIGTCIVLFSKRDHLRNVGEIFVGFGILFIGIDMMTTGLSPLSESKEIVGLFQKFGANPILGILVGAGVTALVQSSSASLGILQSLSMAGIVSWNSAIYIIMGQNIGTCITAMISSIGTTKNAKGAAYIHLLFNVIGSVVFSIIAFIFFTFVNKTMGNAIISTTQIGIVHTGFNVANVILMFPFANALVTLAKKLTAASNAEVDEAEVIHLDDRILNTPSIAIENCIKEIVRLGTMSYENLKRATTAIINKDSTKIDKILTREKNIDILTKTITEYMVKLCNGDITESENATITSLFHTVNDMERIGDHCENLAELTQFMVEDGLDFSDAAKAELVEISNETISCVGNAISALSNSDLHDAERVIRGEERVDVMEKTLRSKHIERLANNECDATVGIAYLDVLTNLERVSDHALNVAQVVLKNRD